MTSSAAMSDRPTLNLSFRAVVTLLVIIVYLTVPACWAAKTYYGVDKTVTSNVYIGISATVYLIVLLLPWLNLKGQEHLSTAQRLEKMCIAWLYLLAAAHVFYELPWLIWHGHILGPDGQGKLWSYAWWAYADGGDLRFLAPDANLLGLEVGSSLVGIITVLLLIARYRSGKFTDMALLVLMAVMICDFYPTLLYYTVEFMQGMPNVRGLADLLIKFIFANSFWLVMPWIVFIWAGRQLIGRRTALPVAVV
jgi:hypothetical protein